MEHLHEIINEINPQKNRGKHPDDNQGKRGVRAKEGKMGIEGKNQETGKGNRHQKRYNGDKNNGRAMGKQEGVEVDAGGIKQDKRE
jgi:hypothetical protein